MKDIKLQGGEVVANASVPGCIVIAGNKRYGCIFMLRNSVCFILSLNRTVQIKNLIEQGEKDVIDFRFGNIYFQIVVIHASQLYNRLP